MYTSIVGSFLSSIQALRVYVESVENKNNDMIIDDGVSFTAGLMYITKMLKVKNINFDDLDLPDGLPQEVINDIKNCIESLEQVLDIGEDGEGGRYRNVPKIVKESYRNIDAMRRQNEILYSGTLMLLVTYFENTISKIFRKDFQRHPERMSLDKKVVSYKILEMSDSIKDVKNHLIDDEVASMMYKSVGEWIEYLKKNLKLKLEYVIGALPQLTEIIARRNLIVHNEGVVNTIYLNLVDEKYTSELNVGDVLGVDRQYISDAIDLIENIGMSIVIEMWINECAKDSAEVDKIVAVIYDEYLIFEKWETAKILYGICLNCKKLQTSNELLCKINMWQCYKWQGEMEKVKSEIESLDVSACKSVYKLGVLALLDKYDEFFDFFDNQDDIGEKELEEWPLFRQVRETKYYIQKYKNTDEYKEDH